LLGALCQQLGELCERVVTGDGVPGLCAVDDQRWPEGRRGSEELREQQTRLFCVVPASCSQLAEACAETCSASRGGPLLVLDLFFLDEVIERLRRPRISVPSLTGWKAFPSAVRAGAGSHR